MPKIEKFVEGIPKAQPRPRAVIRGNRAGVYNPNTADEWKLRIKTSFIGHNGRDIKGPIICNIVFLMPRPQKLNRKKDPVGRIAHIYKPDKDNLEKSVLDALSDINIWGDDCQVYAGMTQKYYCAKDEVPGAIVTILWGIQ